MATEPSLPPDATARLQTFVAAVRRSPHNLLSRRGLAEIEDRHLPECVALAQLLPAGSAHLLDVGSGGGFPGLVIAAVRPDLEVTLLEATAKKAAFLVDAAAEMGVAVQVVNDRAERAVGVLGGRFDLVTARAVAPLHRLIGWTVPFLRPGGLLYAVKGRTWADELAQASGALEEYRATVVGTPDDTTGHGPRVVIIAATSAVALRSQEDV
jgi:16S rRNA (guanine527-N7)-methyltransferase